MYFCIWRDTNTISKGATPEPFCDTPPIAASCKCGWDGFGIIRGAINTKNNKIRAAAKTLVCLKLFPADAMGKPMFVIGMIYFHDIIIKYINLSLQNKINLTTQEL